MKGTWERVNLELIKVNLFKVLLLRFKVLLTINKIQIYKTTQITTRVIMRITVIQ